MVIFEVQIGQKCHHFKKETFILKKKLRSVTLMSENIFSLYFKNRCRKNAKCTIIILTLVTKETTAMVTATSNIKIKNLQIYRL